MDRRQWLALLTIAAGAGVLGYALLAAPTDEERIEERLHALTAAVSSREPVANVLFRASYLREQFEDYLAPSVQVSVPELGRLPSDHRSLALATAQVQSGMGRFEVALSSVQVRVERDRSPLQATVRARADLSAEGRGLRSESRAVRFGLAKEGGTWRVTRIEASSASDFPDDA